jgi:hypothetical protein
MVQNASSETAAAEIKNLRIAMIARGLDGQALAAKSRVRIRTVQNLLTGSYRSWPAKAAINVALGQRIFTKPRLVYRRRQQRAARQSVRTASPRNR